MLLNSIFKVFSINLNAQDVNGMTSFENVRLLDTLEQNHTTDIKPCLLMISKADNSHNVVKKKQTTPLKSGLVLAIKLSEKKEMLAATITDNDRIGQPSLATFVLY